MSSCFLSHSLPDVGVLDDERGSLSFVTCPDAVLQTQQTIIMKHFDTENLVNQAQKCAMCYSFDRVKTRIAHLVEHNYLGVFKKSPVAIFSLGDDRFERDYPPKPEVSESYETDDSDVEDSDSDVTRIE